MPSSRPCKSPEEPPEFLKRMRARRAPKTPRWLSWNGLTMLLAAAAFAFLVWVLSPVLAPFLAAGILAFIFDPMVSRLERQGLSRSLGTLLAVVTLLLAIVLLLLIVLPLFYKEISQLVAQLPGLADQLKTRTVPWINESLGITLNLDAATFRQFVTDNFSDASGVARKVFSSLGIGGLALAGFLVNLLLIPVVLFYVLRDWNLLIAAVDGMVPRRLQPTVQTVASEINVILSEFLRGQISVMLIMAFFYVAGLWLAGLEFALPVGLITGLLVFIPYVGAGTGLLLGTVAAFMQFPTFAGVFAVWGVFAVGQLLEGFLVTPWLVGDRIGLHPVAVIFALLAFGQLFGFFGVLLALPASAAILVGLRHLGAEYRSSELYRR